jgi:TnpA family transposase
VENHWPDLLRVAISIREGRLNSVTLLRRLGSNSRKNEIYRAFREVGRSVRTVALLRYLGNPPLRRRAGTRDRCAVQQTERQTAPHRTVVTDSPRSGL